MAKLKTATAREVARYERPGEGKAKTIVVIRSDDAVLKKEVYDTWSDTFKRSDRGEIKIAQVGVEGFKEYLLKAGFRKV